MNGVYIWWKRSKEILLTSVLSNIKIYQSLRLLNINDYLHEIYTFIIDSTLLCLYLIYKKYKFGWHARDNNTVGYEWTRA